MSDGGADEDLYPNRGRERSVDVSRRLLVAGSLAAGAAAAAGCSGQRGDTGPATGGATTGGETTTSAPVTEAGTVFVFNTGDRTVSVVDVASDEVVATPSLGVTSSFPANQFAPSLTTAGGDPLWLNVGRGVRALTAGSFSQVASVDTGSGANWQAVTPDGRHLVVSAREPAHRQFRVDADPDSADFGTVTAEIDRRPEGGRGDDDGPGPCDVTVHPDGGYAYVPDLFGDTLTVIDVAAFEIARQVPVDPATDAAAASPWMATAAWDGETLLVEHDEGTDGTESVWDVSDPAAPELRARLTSADGLGKRPLTSEIGPDSATGYVFTPGSNDVTVVDLDAGAVTDRIDVGGSAFVGTWGPDREKLYVPVQTSDEVKVIDHAAGEVTATVPVGSRPYGATAATVRPSAGALTNASPRERLAAELAGTGTTYCIGECACGHRL